MQNISRRSQDMHSCHAYSRAAALKPAVCLHLQGMHCPPPKDLRASALSKVSPAMPAPSLEETYAAETEAALAQTPTQH